MISLEQVRALESRVEKAVTLIASLRAENASMRSGLATAELRVSELEGLVADFQKDQARIEEGIVEALRKLDSFEDTVQEAVAQKPAPAPEITVPAEKAVLSEIEVAAAVDRELEELLAEDEAKSTTGDATLGGDATADALDLF